MNAGGREAKERNIIKDTEEEGAEVQNDEEGECTMGNNTDAEMGDSDELISMFAGVERN